MLSACAGVPFDHPKRASTALPVDAETPLGAIELQWSRQHGDLSGILGLPDGMEALGARLSLMAAAQRSIDAQYFIIKKDRAGALFAGKLLLAADRGVRVRLLVDDIFSPGIDDAAALLDSHPNVEVRLFNPMTRQSFRYWSYVVDFARANRRMHNKSFTVDNAVTIVGGRNIGEAYFELDQDVKFDDLEVLAIGPVVEQVSAGFDTFWNSELAVPVEAFDIRVDPARLEDWRREMKAELDRGDYGLYGRAVANPLVEDISEHRVEPLAAWTTLVSDSPEKLLKPVGKAGQAVLAEEKAGRMHAARREVIIITPYFIPMESGALLIEDLLARGVQVVVITNSLASTNHVPVYASYAKYRNRLLRAGVRFYEIRADETGGQNAWGNRPEMVTLHSKATVVDRDTVFIGSLNFDPRSILINTEMGMFIDSRQAATRLADVIYQELPRVSYSVELNEKGAPRWIYRHSGMEEVHDTPPQTSWWRRFMAGFYGVLPLENQL